VGRGAHCERVALESWGSDFSPDCSEVYAQAPAGKPRGDQRWSTFLHNHAKAIVACDFFVAVRVTFRLLYVFIVIEHGSRRLIHLNVTTHPTAAWTLQELREVIGYESSYRYLIHDRDSIFAKNLDESITKLGIKVWKSPPQSPANSLCERLIGTIRRECLDWLIPVSESHLRSMLKIWTAHYNRARPHMSLGPGVPDPPAAASTLIPHENSRHCLGEHLVVHAKSVLGRLHHEYSIMPAVV